MISTRVEMLIDPHTMVWVTVEETEHGFFAYDGAMCVGTGDSHEEACQDFLAEFIAELARRKPTAKIFQFPKRGVYA